ncbi:isoprenylcysteine carboxylmethyltransferase family protein [Mycobacterium intracellulare]|uniref:methyltransferase family protein n=1 Tax=Mycobacterium intracellulare TaxID=1767 RepID=UPI001CD97ED8|nr:isoprenylcysteine carboxylmethyltransferase family protein [Mycobacterium intracellulare]MCA2249777.1 isoprenylcysteine carboxylmethyltransferase family protein [Mycobacterium intracellulare]
MAIADRHPAGSVTGRGWLAAGYVGAGGFFVQEMLLRHRGSASNLNASRDDKGTTRTLLAASGFAYAAPLALRRLPVPSLPAVVGAVGLILQACGLALRVWSMRTLGGFYTRTLRTTQDQTVVDTGPYRVIRHPGYTGALLVWLGLGLTSRSAAATIVVAAVMGRAYRRRISAEERLLQRGLPGYRAYSDRTKKLVPRIW